MRASQASHLSTVCDDFRFTDAAITTRERNEHKRVFRDTVLQRILRHQSAIRDATPAPAAVDGEYYGGTSSLPIRTRQGYAINSQDGCMGVFASNSTLMEISFSSPFSSTLLPRQHVDLGDSTCRCQPHLSSRAASAANTQSSTLSADSYVVEGSEGNMLHGCSRSRPACPPILSIPLICQTL